MVGLKINGVTMGAIDMYVGIILPEKSEAVTWVAASW